ncbi:MAG TPA: DUF4038 domain-containing protein [Gemmatimonadaceae bacterium]|nr:DUF4038 domain-containing protein [Gemmatimonadaceae bacterium]
MNRTIAITALALLAGCSRPTESRARDLALPFTVSADGRWVDRSNGQKFNMNGEAAWSIFAELSRAEATTYLRDRASKGVNVIVANLIEHEFTNHSPASRNANGDLPFTGTVNGEEDFTTPNPAYWSHVDWIINKAAENGIVIMALPAYLGVGHGDQGWATEINANGAARMTTYGTFLGQRYASFPNIIWCMGGDAPPVAAFNLTTHINNLANAIKAADAAHLMTAHSSQGRSSFDDYNQSWLDLNAAYADHFTVHAEVRASRQQTTKPTFLIEGDYGNEHGTTALDLRTEMYQSVLGGGFGHIYGNSPTWYFGVNSSHPANSFADLGGLNWATHLNSFAADQLIYVSRLQAARNLAELTPDYSHTKVTAGYDSGGGEGVTYSPVMASNQMLVAYVRAGGSLTVNRAQFTTATFNVRWYNPRTGATTNSGTAAFGSGSQTFTAPDSNDWVLLLDDVALGLGAP